MRFFGSRRARGIILALVAVLALVLWRASRLYAESVLRNLGPTVIEQLEERLQRKVAVDRLVLDRPGLLLAEGVSVSQGRTFESGALLRAKRVQVRYQPTLLSWTSLWTRGVGQDTRATLEVEGLELNAPNPLPLVTTPHPLLTASRIKADFDLAPLLQGTGDVLATVNRVEVDQPRATALRRRDGTWDFERHLKDQKPTFRGEIRLARAEVRIVDLAPGSLPAPQRFGLAGDVTLQFAAAPILRFSAAGRAQGAEPAEFRVSGHRDSRTRRWFTTVDAHTARMPYWYRYFVKEPKETDVLGGTAHVVGAVWDDEPGPPDKPQFRLDLDVWNGSARVKGIPAPFTGFNGRISTQEEFLTLAGTAELGGNPLRLSGEVLIGPQGHADWSLASDAISLPRLVKTFPDLKLPPDLSIGQPLSFRALLNGGGADETWSARGEAEVRQVRFKEAASPGARLTFEGRFGPNIQPELAGGFHLDSLRHEQVAVRSVGGRFSWRGNLLEATGSFTGMGGRGTARGWVELQPDTEPRFYASGRITDVRLRELPWKVEGSDLAGVGGAEFIVSGTQAKPRVTAFLRGSNLVVKDQEVQELAARVRFEDQVLHVEEAALRDPRGEATLSGTIDPDRKLDLEVAVQGLQLARILDPEAEADGQAYARARITGTVEKPQASGHLKVYRPRFREWSGDLAQAEFQASDSFVQLSALKLIRAPESVTASSVQLTHNTETERWTVQGEFSVEGLSLGRAVLLAGVDAEQRAEWPVAGSVETLRLQVSGDLEQPDLQFSAVVREGAVRGIDVERAEVAGRLDLGRRRLEITTATATSSFGTVAASGTVELPADLGKLRQEGRGAFTFEAKGLPVARLIEEYQPRVREYASIRGEAEIQGSLSGRLAEPDLRLGRVSVAGLVVNGTPVTLDPLKVTLQRDGVIVRDLRAQAGAGEISVSYVGVALPESGGKKPAQPRVAVGAVAVRRMPVPLLLALAEASPAVDERHRDWLEMFDRWARRSGVAQASLSAPEAAGAPSDAEILARLAGRGPEPAQTGEVRVEGLEPVPGLGEPATLEARFRTAPGSFELTRAALVQPGGLEVVVSGRTEGPAETGRLAYSVRVQGVDLGLAAQIPDRELAARLAPVQPLKGVLALTAEVSGTRKQPAVRVSAQVRNPVVAGIPLDRASLENASYSAAQGRLTVGQAVLAKRPSPGAEEATLRLGGYLPLSWPDLSIPGNEERSLTVEFPSQPLSVLNALAEDADRLARQLDYELPAGRESFTRLFGQVLAPEGSIEARVRLAGTANAPNNSGSLVVASENVRLRGLGPSVKRGGWHLPGWLAEEIASAEPLQTVIDGFRMRIELADNAVRVAELSGKSSHGGGFTGGGEVLLGRDVNGGPGARLNLRLALDAFRISEKDAARALGSGYTGTQLRGTLTSVSPGRGQGSQPIRITGDWPNVLVSGTVRLDDASLPLAVDSPRAENPAPLPDNVQLNLAVLPGKEVWLRNPLVRLQLEPPVVAATGRVEGALTVTNRLSEPVIQGNLRASHGVFNLPLIRLRNGEGLIRVAYDGRSTDLAVQQPSPIYVDLTAETTLRIQRAPNVEAEYYDATFEIRGAPGPGGAAGIRATGLETGLAFGAEGGLTVTVRTEPPLPSSQIEALIRQQYVAEGFGTNGSNVVEALRGQIEQAFAVNVASELTGRLEDKVRSALGLSLFSVDFGISQPLRVRLGKRLFGPIYGTIAQSFGAPEDQVERRYEIYYRVSPQFRVGFRQDEPLNQRVFFFSGSASF